ncbi:DUF2142 domain-containing protein [Lactococcus lactis]|uniref:DUF2142 domain-containing protein n=1 Tax=Lactococcus lactis TaxID=1358 RepID=UPI00288DDA7C|nr:DUF2142 domain-containing protein [Lactococcus lactis]MDT2866759.1 DUF2142 domain-containing protein [Lactococcus lactis]MDT2918199.1 DUF2142 domain-containing protein [Lactococcus lactis]
MEHIYTREVPQSKKLGKYIHKIYLIIAIFCGLLISTIMPLFNEPDGQYHFAVSSAIVGLNTDISKYGEDEIGSGMSGQKSFYRNGTFLEQYFFTKATIYPSKDSPRNLDLGNKFNYNYIGHLIPAAGVWIGYHLYPSLGMMIVIARLFSMFVYSVIMYFIIKYLKFGKLLFATVSLSPVIMNTFSSLSYDSLGMVTAAATIALMINMIAFKKVRFWDWILMAILLGLSLIGSKPNLWLINVLFPLVVILVLLMPRSEQREDIYLRRNRVKANLLIRYKWFFSFGLLIIFIVAGSYMTRDRGGLFEVIIRLIFTQSFRFYDIYSPGDFGNLLVSPYPYYNYMPTILIAIWGILIVLVSISEKAFHKSVLLSFSASLVIMLGIFSAYYGFLGYGSLSGFALRMTIQGVQWRYFTPLLLLLPLIFSNERIKFRVPSRNSVVIFMIVTAIVSNFLLVFNTLWGMIMV